MKLDDVKRLLTRQTLFRLDAILSPKLMPIFYALGLAGILLWIVSHFFFRFSQGFGNGLWGILEIAVFGLLAFVALRILCEALLIWFKNHESAGETVQRSRCSMKCATPFATWLKKAKTSAITPKLPNIWPLPPSPRPIRPLRQRRSTQRKPCVLLRPSRVRHTPASFNHPPNDLQREPTGSLFFGPPRATQS
jgi:hypothetical protein